MMRRAEKRSFPKSIYLALPLLLALTAWGSYHLTEQNKKYAHQTVSSDCGKAVEIFSSTTRQTLQSLDRMARRIGNQAYLDRTGWELDAAQYMSDFPGVLGTAWITSDFHVKWFYPVKGLEKYQNFNLSNDPIRKAALEQVVRSRAPGATQVVEFFQGGKGVIVYIPINGAKKEGFLGVALDHKLVLQNSLAETLQNYSVTVLDGTEEIYRHGDFEQNGPDNLRSSIRFLNRTWTLVLHPTPGARPQMHSFAPWVALLIGLMTTALICALLLLAHKANLHAEDLERSEETFRMLVSGIKEYAIFMLDPAGNIVSWNDGAARITGYGEGEILGKNFSSFYSSQDVEMLHPQMELDVAKGTGRYEEIGIRFRKDGTRFWAHSTLNALYDPQKNLRGFAKIIRDITKERDSETTIQLHNKIVNNMSEGVYLIRGSDRKILYANAAFERMHGFEPGELIGKDVQVVTALSQEDLEKKGKEISQALDEKGFWRGEIRKRSKSGEILWTQASVTKLQHSEHGDILVAVHMDISERKKMEEVAAEHTKQIEEANRRFELVTEGSSVGIWDWLDIEKDEEYWSPRFFSLLGYASGEIPSTLETFKSLLHPEDVGHTIDKISDHFIKKVPFDTEYRLRTKSGAYRWFQGTGKASFDASGRPTRMVGSIQDIQSRKQLEHELRNVAESRSMFLANMSHEIRTPMNGIIGMTTLLLQHQLSPDARDCAETIRKSSEVLLSLVNDILDISKVEAGKITIEKESFDIRSIVETVIDLFAESAQEKGLYLSAIVQPSVPKVVIGDSTRFQQIISNLVSNAVKFTKAGEVSVRVSADKVVGGSSLLTVDVLDSGIGMNRDTISKLFIPFTQGDASTTRRFGGTGLGLSICKKLVQLMGGDIEVQSEVGKGTRFRACIPFESAQTLPSAFASVAGTRVAVVSRNAFATRAIGELVRVKELAPHFVERVEDVGKLMVASEPVKLCIVDVDEKAENLQSEINRIEAILEPYQIGLVLILPRNWRAASVSGKTRCIRKPIKQSQLFQAVARALAMEDLEAETKPAAALYGEQSPAFLNAKGAVPTCLVAEDNSTNQKVMASMLKKLGVSCDVVGNGAEAIAAIQKVPYDMILMDCFMPEMDGYEATQHIRRLPGNAGRVPIIAVTANVSPKEQGRCKAAGMDSYLSKPVNFEELQALLAQWFPVHSSEAQKVAKQP